MDTETSKHKAGMDGSNEADLDHTMAVSTSFGSQQNLLPGAGALKLDGDTGELRPEVHARFRWIVAGRQVGAQWRDDQELRHLGGPSPVNAKDCPLCLWIGLDIGNNNELLILLTQSVKLGTGSRARPRHMFLVIPAESLALGSSAHGFASLGLNQVPEALFERPSDTRSANSNGFLHISFVLGSKRGSRVLMPIRPYEHLARGTALSLLDGLKSLSEAQGFDLYLKFNSYAQFDLQRLEVRMASRIMVTPSFDLVAMYRGDRDGGFDLWKEQGWHDEQASRQAVCQDDRVTAGALRQDDAPQHMKIRQPVRGSQILKESLAIDESSRLWISSHSDQSPVEIIEPEPRSRKRRVSQEPGTPPPFQKRDTGPPPAYHESTSDVVVIPRSCSPHDVVRRSLSVISETSRVCETPQVEVSPSTKLAQACTLEISKVCQTPQVGPYKPTRLAQCSIFETPTALHTPPTEAFPPASVQACNLSLPSARFYKELPRWLSSAWRSCPYAHYLFVLDLLTAGHAANREDLDGYHKARVALTTRFVSYEADQRAADDFGQILDSRRLQGTADEAVLSSELTNLTSWMLIVEPAADSLLFGLLIELEKRRKHVLQSLQSPKSPNADACDEGHEDDYNQLLNRYLDMRSLIVIEVCFQHGATALERKDELVKRMAEEMDSISRGRI